MPVKRGSAKAKSEHLFGHARRPARMFRVGLYARVSTEDQNTLAMQNRAMREYAVRRLDGRHASPRGELRRSTAPGSRETTRSGSPSGNRRSAGLAPGSLGRSVTDLLATLQSRAVRSLVEYRN